MDYERVYELFRGARVLVTATQRETYLAESRADADTLQRVRALLEHHDAADAAPQATALSPLRAAMESAWEGPDPDATLPDHIGPYRILGRLGEGGMASVFRAQQEEPKRQIALKVLHMAGTGPAGIARFRQEAEVLGRLNHEGIAQVYDVGEAQTPDGTRPYLTMELIEGAHLTAAAPSVAGTSEARVELLLQILDATAHAHRNGIVHRDLKPSNVIVNARGRCKLLDFGIARVVGEDSAHTATGDVLGTLRYMSPEQAGGEVRIADTRADVYAIGVMAYELLGGRHPWDGLDGGPAAILSAILTRTPKSLREVAPDVAPDLATIIHKAMERDPDRRYSGADTLAADLRRFLSGLPIEARDPTLSYQVRRFVGRHKAIVAGAAVAVSALIVAVVLSLAYARRENEHRKRADAQAEIAQQGAALLRIQAADTAWKEDRLAAALDHLETVEPSRRTWAWRFAQARCDNALVRLPFEAGPGVCRVWPDGRAESLGPPEDASLQGALVRHGEQGEKRTMLRTKARRLSLPWLAPATARVEYERVVVEPKREGVLPTLKKLRASAVAMDVSREEILVGTFQRRVKAWNPVTGTLRDLDIEAAGPVRALAFHADGELLAVASAKGVIQLFSLPDGALVETCRTGGCGALQLAFVNDGRHLVALTPESLLVWERGAEARHSRLPLSVPGRRSFVYGIAVAPDGRRVAAASWSGSVEMFDLVRARSLGPLGEVVQRAHALRFVDGGRSLVVLAAGRLVLRDAVTGEDSGPSVSAAPTRDMALLARPGLAAAMRLRNRGSELCLLPLDGSEGRTVSLPAVPGEAGQEIERPHLAPLAMDAEGHHLVRRSMGGWACHRWPDLAVVSHGDTREEIGILTRLRIGPGGEEFVGATTRGLVTVRDVRTGRERLRLAAHEGAAYGLAIHPAEDLLATGGADGAIRLWSLETGDLQLVLTGHEEYVHDLAFTPDGTTLISGSGDGTLRVWSTRPLAERWQAARETR